MRAISQIVLFFILAQVLGILTGSGLIEAAKQIPDLNELNISPVGEPDSLANSVIFIAYIIFGAAMFILMARFYRGVLLFRLLESMVIFSASFVVFFAFLLSYLGFGLDNSFLPSAFLSLLLAAGKYFFEQAKNAAAIISSAGVGALFGFSIGFLPTLLFVVLLSAYDYIAVFKTRHMVALAREFTSRSLSFSVTAHAPKQVSSASPAKKMASATKASSLSVEPKDERLDLGTGDIAIPAMLAVSAYSLGGPLGGIENSIAVMAGSSLALLLLLNLVVKRKIFLPALPPLCLGGLIALLILRLAIPA